jgi:hypothetical protein
MENKQNWFKHHRIYVVIFLCVIVYFIYWVGVNNGIFYFPDTSQSTAVAQDTWYYVNQNYQCVEAPNKYQSQYPYQNADACQKDVGTYCYSADPTCGGYAKQETFYYINSESQCVLAPHNPYSPMGKYGYLNQYENCVNDVGQPCYQNDNTCGGITTSSVAINGIAYKLVTTSELKQNSSVPGFANNTGGTGPESFVSIKGTISVILSEKSGTDLLVVIKTQDGPVLLSLNNLNPDTKESYGFSYAKFPEGTQVLVGGIYISGPTLLHIQDFEKFDAQLESMNLPADTQILVVTGNNVKAI